MLILLPVLQGVLSINPFSIQPWQELNPLAIISVQVHVVDLALHAGVTDRKVDAVNVSAVLVLVLLLDHVLLVEFSQGFVKVCKHFVELAANAQVLAVTLWGYKI